jgi:hypothetical protein
METIKMLKNMVKTISVGLFLIVGLPIGCYYSFGEDGLLDYVERFGSGFDTIKEYRKAEKAGFTNKDKYEADLKKKAEILAEQKRKEEELALETARKQEEQKQKRIDFFEKKGFVNSDKIYMWFSDGSCRGNQFICMTLSQGRSACEAFVGDVPAESDGRKLKSLSSGYDLIQALKMTYRGRHQTNFLDGASTQFDYVYWDEKRQECVAQASISGVHKGEPLAGNIFGQLAGFEYMDGEFKEKYFSMQMPNMPYE